MSKVVTEQQQQQREEGTAAAPPLPPDNDELLEPSDLNVDEMSEEKRRELDEVVARCKEKNDLARQERQWRGELNALCLPLEKQLDAFQDDIDKVTLENIAERRAVLFKYLAEYQRNPVIYCEIMPTVLSILMSYAVKECFMRVETKHDYSKQQFYLTAEMRNEVVLDVARVLSRKKASPVRVQYWDEMLYPQNVHKFDTVVPADVHTYLVHSAKNMLEDLDARLGKLGVADVDEEDDAEKADGAAPENGGVHSMSDEQLANLDPTAVAHLREYWRSMSMGMLPAGYVPESEREWPRRTLHYMEMLDPDSANRFANTLTPEAFGYVQEHAKKRLDSYNMLDEQTKRTEHVKRNIAHLKSVIAGRVPFGYRLTTAVSAANVQQQPKAKAKRNGKKKGKK